MGVKEFFGKKKKEATAAVEKLDPDAPPVPYIKYWLYEPVTFDKVWSMCHVVFLVTMGFYTSQTETVAGQYVGWKVAQDAFWAYFGFATGYAHAIATGAYIEYNQYAMILWIANASFGFGPIFAANPVLAYILLIQNSISIVGSVYIAFKPMWWKLILKISPGLTPPLFGPVTPLPPGPKGKCCGRSILDTTYLIIWFLQFFATAGSIMAVDPTVALGPLAKDVTMHSARYIGIQLFGWSSGLYLALKTDTAVLYAQVELPLLFGDAVWIFVSSYSMEPFILYTNMVYIAYSMIYIYIAFKDPSWGLGCKKKATPGADLV